MTHLAQNRSERTRGNQWSPQGLNLPSNLRQDAFWVNCERITAPNAAVPRSPTTTAAVVVSRCNEVNLDIVVEQLGLCQFRRGLLWGRIA